MITTPPAAPPEAKPGGPLSRRDVALLKAQLCIAQPARAKHWPSLIDMKLETNARPNELLGAHWDEFDEAGKVWRLPASRGKYGARDIDLSNKAIKTLRRLRKLAEPGDDRLFPCFESAVDMGNTYAANAIVAGLGTRLFRELGEPTPRALSRVRRSLGRSIAANFGYSRT